MRLVSLIRHRLHRWFVSESTSRPEAAPNVRSVFEARYENELFLADELLSGGGPASPEDHVWLDRVLAAYAASSDAAYDPSREIPDPWAPDTQAEIFEPMPELPGPETGRADALPRTLSSGDDEDPITQARELREEAARVRKELQPAVAALAHQRGQLHRSVSGLREVLRRLGGGQK
jgi:hypothetical protein